MARKKVNTKKNEPTIQQVRFEKTFKEDAIEYGTEVAVNRALPDFRDGLKPVDRRILYSMVESKFFQSKPYHKSALVVGRVMGEYHAHGDASIYDVLVRMSCFWRQQLKYIDLKGNNGNYLGRPAAASRYTEVRLDELVDELLKRLQFGVVPFVDNYSFDKKEPTVLPIPIPALLINGAFGIASGFISSIPEHNPIEALQAFKVFCKKRKVTLEDIYKVMPGPDFVLGGEIFRIEDMRQFYECGSASINVRGKTKIEKNKVLIYEVPYNLSGSILDYFENLTDLIANKKLVNAQSVTNYSDKKGVWIEVTAKNKDVVKDLEKELYDKTALQSTKPLRFNVVNGGRPVKMNLMEYFTSYKEFVLDTIKKDAQVKLEKLEHQILISSGIMTALDKIDLIIELIRNSKSNSEAIEALQSGKVTEKQFKTKIAFREAKKFSFTEEQARAIVAIQLGRLSNLSKIELIDKHNELLKEKNSLSEIIADEKKQEKVLLKDIDFFIKLFTSMGFDKRKTTISNQDFVQYKETEKVFEYNLNLDKFGYLKLLNPESKQEDSLVSKIVSSKDSIGFFSNLGNFHKFKLSDFKSHTLKDKGELLSGLIQKPSPEEYLIINSNSMLHFPETGREENQQVFICTSDGFAKTVLAEEYNVKTRRSVGTKLTSGQEVVSAELVRDRIDFAVLVTEKGKVKKVKLSDINLYKKNTKGMSVGKLSDDRIKQVYLVGKKDKVKISGKTVPVSELKTEKLSTVFKNLK